ncbi:MAG: nucleotidyltransferase family protein [Myxococcota bacterium]
MKEDRRQETNAGASTAILLAAGAGRRMGEDKLLLDYRGRPLILHPLAALSKSAGVRKTVVVVRPGFGLPPLPPGGPPVQMVENPFHEQGMGSSLRAGVAASPVDTEAFVIVLADMPLVGPRLIEEVLGAWRRSRRPIAAPVFQGRRGHPVVVSASLRESLLACSGDQGLRGLIREHPELVCEVETADPGCVFDVDTPQDLSREEVGAGPGDWEAMK